MMLKSIKKKTALFLLAAIISAGFFGVKSPVRAGAWGESIESVLMHEAWVEIREAFINAMVANLKMEANNLIKDQIVGMLGGSGDSGLVIGDYENFIYNNSRENANAYVYDFFRDLNSGVSPETSGMYETIEKSLLSSRQDTKEASTIDQYVSGGSENIFKQSEGGGTQALMASVTNDYNNPFGTYLRSQSLLARRMEIEQNKAEVEAISGQGFKSRRDGNLIDLPGSVLADITAKSKSNYFDLINNATSIPELAGTLSAGILTQSIKEGVTGSSGSGGGSGGFSSQSNQTFGESGGSSNMQNDIYNGIEFDSGVGGF
jgi:hypothetical protein